jgi:hypothetical protein
MAYLKIHEGYHQWLGIFDSYLRLSRNCLPDFPFLSCPPSAVSEIDRITSWLTVRTNFGGKRDLAILFTLHVQRGFTARTLLRCNVTPRTRRMRYLGSTAFSRPQFRGAHVEESSQRK